MIKKIIAMALLAGVMACSQKKEPEITPTTGTESQEAPASSPPANPDFEMGRKIYRAQCISCHHANPQMTGASGPPVAGSSLELLKARVLKATYPPGYKPQRTTRQMTPLPFLEKHIPQLHVYLNSPEFLKK